MKRLRCSPTSLWRIVLSATTLMSVNLGAQTPGRRTLTEDLRIDVAKLVVQGVTGMVELRDGGLLMGDMDGLLVLSSRGDLVRNIGRFALGTPEIRRYPRLPGASSMPTSDSLPTIDGVARFGLVGDTIWIADQPNQRLIFLNDFGAILKVVPGDSSILMRITPDPARRRPPVTYHPPVMWMAPHAVLPGGSVITRQGVYLPLTEPIGVAQKTAIMRGTLNGIATDTIAVIATSIGVTGLRDDAGNRAGIIINPFLNWNFVGSSQAGNRVVALEVFPDGPNAPRYQIRMYDDKGQHIYQRFYDYVPVAVTATLVDSVVSATVSRLSNYKVGDTVSAVRRALNMPSTLPPITDVRVGPDGDVWLRGREIAGSRLWTILNPSGDPVGTIAEPPGMTIISVGRDVIWCVQTNAQHQPMFVVRYRVGSLQPGW